MGAAERLPEAPPPETGARTRLPFSCSSGTWADSLVSAAPPSDIHRVWSIPKNWVAVCQCVARGTIVPASSSRSVLASSSVTPVRDDDFGVHYCSRIITCFYVERYVKGTATLSREMPFMNPSPGGCERHGVLLDHEALGQHMC